MSLDDLIQDESGGTHLRHNIERLDKEHLCPNCGAECENDGHGRWYCPKSLDECEVIKYRHPPDPFE